MYDDTILSTSFTVTWVFKLTHKKILIHAYKNESLSKRIMTPCKAYKPPLTCTVLLL